VLCSSFDVPSTGRRRRVVLRGAALRWRNVTLREPGATARLCVTESLSHLLAICYSDSLPSVKNMHLISSLNFSDLSCRRWMSLCTVFIRSERSPAHTSSLWEQHSGIALPLHCLLACVFSFLFSSEFSVSSLLGALFGRCLQSNATEGLIRSEEQPCCSTHGPRGPCLQLQAEEDAVTAGQYT